MILILGRSRDDLLKRFRSVEPVGRLDNLLGMPDESGLTLWLCRDSVEPLQEAWPRLRQYVLARRPANGLRRPRACG